MRVRDGELVFQLTEELRELAAIDAVELLAVDHPSDADGRYAPIGRHRVAGFADEHAIVLEAPEGAGPLWLFLTGWVYWPSSSSMRALDAHGSMKSLPPVLQVQNAEREWVTVIEDVGLPSAMHRALVTDLTGKFLSRDRRVRIVSNFGTKLDATLLKRGCVRAVSLPCDLC